MIEIAKADAKAPQRSEKRFLRLIDGFPGVALVNLELARLGRRDGREIDVTLLTPTGVFTVEVKGVGASGLLATPAVGAWTIGGQSQVWSGKHEGRPGSQALLQSKIVAGLARDFGAHLGFVEAIVAIDGDGVTLPGAVRAHFAEQSHVVLLNDGVYDDIQSVVRPHGRRDVSVETVRRFLESVGCEELTPTAEALEAEGFLWESEIEAAKRVRLATIRREESVIRLARERERRQALAAKAEHAAVAAGAQSHGDRLSEITLVEDGVPFARTALGQIRRLDVSASLVVAVLRNPESQTWPGTDGNVAYFGSHGLAVAVRDSDKAVVSVKPLDEALRMRDGIEIGEIVIAPEALRSADFLRLSVEEVLSVVAEPTKILEAPHLQFPISVRDDYAVTITDLGIISHVTTAESAERLAAGSQDRTRTDVMVDGITIAGSALAAASRSGVTAHGILDTVREPVGKWASHFDGIEVFLGRRVAVLYRESLKRVTGVTTIERAVEYRDGLALDGYQVTGTALREVDSMRLARTLVPEAISDPERTFIPFDADASVYVRGPLGVYVSHAEPFAAFRVESSESLLRRARSGEMTEVVSGAGSPRKSAPSPQRNRASGAPRNVQRQRPGTGNSSGGGVRRPTGPDRNPRPAPARPTPAPAPVDPVEVDGVLIHPRCLRRAEKLGVAPSEVALTRSDPDEVSEGEQGTRYQRGPIIVVTKRGGDTVTNLMVMNPGAAAQAG